MLSGLAAKHRVPIAYCNAVGGNDQLIFDGHSLAIGADGQLLARLPGFSEELAVIDLAGPSRAPLPPLPPETGGGASRARAGAARLPAQMRLSSPPCSASAAASIAPSSPASRRKRSGRKTCSASPCPRLFLAAAAWKIPALLAERLGIQFLEIPIKAAFESRACAIPGNFRRPAGERGRGKHAATPARPDAHGALQQAWPPPAYHRQQERTLRRLLHALWRHVRRPGGHLATCRS